MTLIYGGAITRAGLPNPGPMTQIQPFTYEDGITFAEILYALKTYIEKTLVPYIIEQTGEIDERIATLIATVDNALAVQEAAVNAALAEQSANNAQAIADMIAYVNAQVQAIIEDSIQVQDPVMAGIMGDDDSATRGITDPLYGPTAASEAYGTAAGVVFPEGAALGVPLSHDSLQAALTAAAGTGNMVVAAGEYTTDQTLTILDSADLSRVVINYSGTGTAVVVGENSTFHRNLTIHTPTVIQTRKAVTGWVAVAGTVGIHVVNIYSSQIYLATIRNFETGLRVYGADGNGTAYVTFFMGHLDNNKVNFTTGASGTGWANQNTYIGGRYSHNSAEGQNTPGVIHIRLEATSPNAAPNNNVWLNASLESPTVVQYTIDVIAGSQNMWINPRFEYTGGQGKVRWGAQAVRNIINSGYGSDFIEITYVSGEASNSVYGTSSMRFNPQGSSGGMIVSNYSSAAHPEFTTLANKGDDPVTGYTSRHTKNIVRYKRTAEAFDRAIIDGSAGRVTLGSGAVAPVAGVLGANTALLVNGGTTVFGAETDNTCDLGSRTTVRFRDITAGRAIRPGQYTTATRPAVADVGTGAIIFDTDLGKMIMSKSTGWFNLDGTAL